MHEQTLQAELSEVMIQIELSTQTQDILANLIAPHIHKEHESTKNAILCSYTWLIVYHTT